MENSQCELCGREPLAITRHHLIPRARHRKMQARGHGSKSDLEGRIALLCRTCHQFIHRVLSEKEMSAEYNTVERLRSHSEIASFVHWLSAKPAGLHVNSARPRPNR